MGVPPELPPRADPQLRPQAASPSPSESLSDEQSPPDYEAATSSYPPLGLGHLSSTDPRTSSTQSLVPSIPGSALPSEGSRRTLLVVYIHGFYGNDQSFRSFPAHVHSYLKSLLSESHVIHSKIYPRYKTYKAIEVARDKLSAWLEPHESPTTDVVLIGHSMGGLLAADLVLKPNHNPHLQQSFKHRILGTISLDSPFLGLHPGIVVSGLSSLFQSAPKPTDQTLYASPPPTSPASPLEATPSLDSHTQSLSSVSSFDASGIPDRQPLDPNFDPPFFNDEPFREQPLLKRLIHFASKHKSEGIFNAVGNHLLSHLEYGGCLADYPALVGRYKKIRALEDVDDLRAVAEGHPLGTYVRVRFVNYYTLSSGRPNPPKSSVQTGEAQEPSQSLTPGFGTSTPRISIEDHDEEQSSSLSVAEDKKLAEPGEEKSEPSSSLDINRLTLQNMDPIPMEDVDPIPIEEAGPAPVSRTETEITDAGTEITQTESTMTTEPQTDSQTLTPTDEPELPQIPELPAEPTPPNLEQYTDKDARKQAEKEFKRIRKAYDNAIKDRNKAVREREKLVEKRQRRAQKATEKVAKAAQKEQQRLEKEEKKRVARDELTAKQTNDLKNTIENGDGSAGAADAAERPKKQRKFCTLPSKVNGKMDPTWVDVYMDGVDEVGAHCGLFFVGPHYDQLVGDLGDRIFGWVQEDMSKRAFVDVD